MSSFLYFPTMFFFAARMLLIKTPADILFFFCLILLFVLELFRENSGFCRFLYSACCVSMCFFCLILASLNTVFDATFLTTCAIWLVLLISPVLDKDTCFAHPKNV